MGVTGASGFPCCGKGSVDIMETQVILNQHQQAQEEDDMELENELQTLEPPHNLDLDLELGPKLEMEMEAKAAPQLEPRPAPQLEPRPAPQLEPRPAPMLMREVDLDADLEACDELLEQQRYRIQSLHSYTEEKGELAQWSDSLRSTGSNSSYPSSLDDEELSTAHHSEQLATAHRSIQLQTSKHLFWADKLIQTSEHSLQQETSIQPGKKSTDKTTSHLNQEPVPRDTLCSKQQLQNPSAQPAGSQQPPSAHSSASSLPQALSLANVISLASSMAMASSSTMDLASWEHLRKAPPQKAVEASAAPIVESATQPAEDKPEQETLSDVLERPPEKPLDAQQLQKAWKQEDKNFYHPNLDFRKPGLQRATTEGQVKLLQFPAMSLPQKGDRNEQQKTKRPPATQRTYRPPQKPQRLLTRDPEEERAGRTQKGRPQQHASLLTQMEPAAAMATGPEQASRRAKEFKSLSATHSVQSGPGAGHQSFADKNPLPLTPQQLAAFQEIFKLFSSSPTGTVDTRSLKVALRSVHLRLSPQEMCEALQQADLDGDGTVSFKDFLGVLTDSHRLAQCLRQVTNSRVCDPQNLQTLFLEVLFKLMRQGFVPYKSAQEVISYYSKKQRALRLNSGCKSPDRSHSHGRSACVHAGLTFFCQAARLSGLSYTELVRSLRRLHNAAPGVHSPYSQIPILAEGTRPAYKTWNRASRPEVRLPKSYPSKSYPSSCPQPGPNPGRRSPEFGDQPLEYAHPWKLAPSPPTLVQKQPFSPSPASLQRPAMKNLYK